MTGKLLDARGVEIEAGDTVICGFGVGRSVAMAEGFVLENENGEASPDGHRAVSLTPSGRVRVRVVRCSYGEGGRPVVDLAPDRLVVLKIVEYRIPGYYDDPETGAFLPPSPLPTQAEAREKEITEQIEHYRQAIADLEAGGDLPAWTKGRYTRERMMDLYREWTAELRADLKKIREQ